MLWPWFCTAHSSSSWVFLFSHLQRASLFETESLLPTWNVNATIKELWRLFIKIHSLMHFSLLRLLTRQSSSPDWWSVLNPYEDPRERSVPCSRSPLMTVEFPNHDVASQSPNAAPIFCTLAVQRKEQEYWILSLAYSFSLIELSFCVCLLYFGSERLHKSWHKLTHSSVCRYCYKHYLPDMKNT